MVVLFVSDMMFISVVMVVSGVSLKLFVVFIMIILRLKFVMVWK